MAPQKHFRVSEQRAQADARAGGTRWRDRASGCNPGYAGSVTGHFVALDPTVAHDIEAAWKRVMILNATQVLYTFTYDPATVKFSAHKR